MMDYTPSSNFHDAASYLSSSTVKTSTAIKLELYGLFKYLTVAPTPTTSRPSIFDPTGRAKWDAWNTTRQTYVSFEDVEARYIQMAQNLGWVKGFEVATKSGVEHADQEDIWDNEGEYQSSGHDDGGGMGNSVSAMAPPPEVDDQSIHGLAISDQTVQMSSHLEQHPNGDLNERDEFGYTPLHLASDRGNVAMVELLLAKGADPTVKDPDNLSASELAHIAGHVEIEKILTSFNYMR